MQVRTRRVASATTPYHPARGRRHGPTGLLVALAAVFLLAGCTDGTRGASTSTPTVTGTAAPTPTPGTTANEATPPPPGAEPPPAPPVPAPTGPGGAEVVVTNAGWLASSGAVEVAAYVAAVEAGGRCTLTLTGPGGATATASQTAEPDASTTSCGLLAVPGDQLTSGTWTGTVAYVSPTTSGEAAVAPMQVP